MKPIAIIIDTPEKHNLIRARTVTGIILRGNCEVGQQINFLFLDSGATWLFPAQITAIWRLNETYTIQHDGVANILGFKTCGELNKFVDYTCKNLNLVYFTGI